MHPQFPDFQTDPSHFFPLNIGLNADLICIHPKLVFNFCQVNLATNLKLSNIKLKRFTPRL
jgi:hypothetical protein